MKKILIIFVIIFVGCGEDKKKDYRSNYKKQSDIPITGTSIDKKNNPKGNVGDYY